jgi:cytochrome c-type biogenesis protein CcmH/NrfG
LSQKKEKTLEDALRYFSIGNIYFSQERMGKALAAYEQAATIDPENPDILNNLAWLLSFQSTAQFFDPQRALLLAEKAVKLKPAAHIFDTYAQTLFVNGRLVEAVEIQEQALRSADDEDRRIYEERLQHFTDALASDKNSNDRK